MGGGGVGEIWEMREGDVLLRPEDLTSNKNLNQSAEEKRKLSVL